MTPQKFSIRQRAKSFSYAWTGIVRFINNEHNARIHLAATVLVVLVSLALKVSAIEAAALAGAVGLVWVAEMLNTCLEKSMDLISKEHHPVIKFIKDLAAGAVLIAAVTAVIIGLFIFIPKIL